MPTLFPHTRFLLGSALAACAVSLAAPASAQIANGSSLLTTSGNIVTRSEQTEAQTTIEANVIDGQIDFTGAATNSDLVVAGESLVAAAVANRAAASLTPSIGEAAAPVSTYLTIDADGVTARAAGLSASRQVAEDTYVASRISGYPLKMQLGAALDDVAGSTVSITRNFEKTSALANDATARLDLETSLGLPGAAILSDQAMRGASTVLSDQGGAAIITAGSVSASRLDLSGNTQHAFAQGNGATNQLAATAGSLGGQFGPGSLSLVAGDFSAAQSGASLAVLSSQSAEGRIAAHGNGAIAIEVADGANASTISADGNSLLAAATGNRSQDILHLETNSLSVSPVGTGPLPVMARTGAAANVTNIQVAGIADITASSHVAPKIAMGGDATGLSASIDGTSVQAIATANLAEANELTVRGGSLGSAVIIPPTGGGGGIGWPPLPPIGTALVDGDGTMSATASFSVQNLQTSNARTVTWIQDGLVAITAEQLRSSDLSASDNDFAAVTTGNRAISLLDLEAATIASSADLSSVQIEYGNLASYAGHQGDPAGVALAASHGAADAAFRVTGNSVNASTTANMASNILHASASSLANASGHTAARAGQIPGGTGASADFALANMQRAEGTADGPVTVLAEADGKFGVSVGGISERVVIDVGGNELSAKAAGNTSANSVALIAANMGGNGSTSPYSALSNSQGGNADVIARSSLRLEALGSGPGSNARLAGNSNIASSVINTASNAVSIQAAVVTGSSGTAATESNSDWGTAARGDHVLANLQVARGSAAAETSTHIVLPVSPAAQGSAMVLENNRTVAAASGNEGSNSLAVAAVNQTRVAPALLNRQASSAEVLAHAIQTLSAGNDGAVSARSDYAGNSVIADARGNQASNSMQLAGAAAMSGSPMILGGPLNSVPGGPLLANMQENTGSVTSAAVSSGAQPAFSGGVLNGAMDRMGGNAVQAVAFGNSASNVIDRRDAGSGLAAAMISNAQTNSGIILATAYGIGEPSAYARPDSLGASVTGNVISAQAIGNYSASSIGTRR